MHIHMHTHTHAHTYHTHTHTAVTVVVEVSADPLNVNFTIMYYVSGSSTLLVVLRCHYRRPHACKFKLEVSSQM